MSVKTSLLFYFFCLYDFSGTTKILILVFFYRVYCSLTEALGLSVSIVLWLRYWLLMFMIYGTGSGTVIYKTDCFCGSSIDRLCINLETEFLE